jgi:hypothetical protein
MKKIILLLMFLPSFLISQEVDTDREGLGLGAKVEGGIFILDGYGKGEWGISLPVKYAFNRQWAAEINPGFTGVPEEYNYNFSMGMRGYYFPFRTDYSEKNFFVFFGLDNIFGTNANKKNSNYTYNMPIVSLLFGTGINLYEETVLDLSVSIPFVNSQYLLVHYPNYSTSEKMYACIRVGITYLF